MIYLAGPFFNDHQSNIISNAEEFLDDARLAYFSPRKGIASKAYATLMKNSSKSEINLIKSCVFNENIDYLNKSDILYINPEGFDSGTFFKLGYYIAKRYSEGKRVSIVNMNNNVSIDFNMYISKVKQLFNEESYLINCVSNFNTTDLKIEIEDGRYIRGVISESGDYLALSKVLLGAMYELYCNSIDLVYFDKPRDFDLMITCSARVFEGNYDKDTVFTFESLSNDFNEVK